MKAKEGIRILGIDDSPFKKKVKGEKRGKGKEEKVLIVGVVYRSGIIEGIISTHIKRDGNDGTEKLSKMIKGSRFSPQIKLILMNGIMMAGFNAIDISSLSKKLSVPIIAITRRKPNMKDVKKALKNVKGTEKKLKIIKKVGPSKQIKFNEHPLYVQIAGLSVKEAEEQVNKFGLESLRLAHLIGSGIVKGESSGRI